ncbi:GNAT family N-acetyltransferase [Ponticaulis sp.]|uniref:GNAT family N-acetyltransferase n=1 Tax=Ponticaulis sp. TaxID=2020902 RepID=UPI0025DD4D78|nr:GNAT family N-acetyltransferase [Ponticaulis sp.]
MTSRETPSPELPEGFAFIPFNGEAHAREARTLLNLAFANGGGEVEDFDDWWACISDDSEFDAECCFVLFHQETGKMAAFAHCWSSGFVKDIGVHPNFRRIGLARAMMFRIFAEFRSQGFPRVELKARADNQTGALELYRWLGMSEERLGTRSAG